MNVNYAKFPKKFDNKQFQGNYFKFAIPWAVMYISNLGNSERTEDHKSIH